MSNISKWRIPVAAEAMTGFPVFMPDDHLEMTAECWLDLFLENDANGVREMVETKGRGPSLRERTIQILTENPGSAEKFVRHNLEIHYHATDTLTRMIKAGLAELVMDDGVKTYYLTDKGIEYGKQRGLI